MSTGRKTVTPLVKLLISVKLDMLLTFLNTMHLEWSLVRGADGSFEAEIWPAGDPERVSWYGEHTYIPHHALAHAIGDMLLDSELDFHEYLPPRGEAQ